MGKKYKLDSSSDWSTIVAFIFIVVIMLGLLGWLTMFLWNSVLVALFPSLPEISYWLALGLWIIIRLVIK